MGGRTQIGYVCKDEGGYKSQKRCKEKCPSNYENCDIYLAQEQFASEQRDTTGLEGNIVEDDFKILEVNEGDFPSKQKSWGDSR